MVFFTVGCNFRCPFCHNPELIFNVENTFEDEEALNMIRNRVKLINSVTITGGEPTLNKDLPSFIKKVKEMGLKVKLDTNGSFPSILEECINDVDYVAMDVKTSLNKYKRVGYTDVENIKKSIKIIMERAKDYEFRITLAPGIVNVNDLDEIGNLIKGSSKLYLQQFRVGNTLDEHFKPTPYSFEEINMFKEKFSKYVNEVKLRI